MKLLFLLFSWVTFFAQTNYPIYIDQNGVTVKAAPNAVIGETYELDGKTYGVVNDEMLRSMVNDEADPDSDTPTYTLLIDTVDGRQEAAEENTGLTDNTKEVTVETGTIYYWSVITSNGSISVPSNVFGFRVD